MKFLNISLLFLFTATLMHSLSKENENIKAENNTQVESLQIVKSFTSGDYTIELLNESGQLMVGYNKIHLRLTAANANSLNPDSLSWMPMMTMKKGDMTHQHSCPFSEITKVPGKDNLYEGYIVFIMPSDEPNNYWDLKISFKLGGQNFESKEQLQVISTQTDYAKVFTSGIGSDAQTYFLALVEPTAPKIGTNDIVVALFKKAATGDFPIVDNYKIKVDPRMPGMDNHSSAGNVDMLQSSDAFYHGKVGFSMSGYWKINLILEDDLGKPLKGEVVSEQNPESSLNFQLEF